MAFSLSIARRQAECHAGTAGVSIPFNSQQKKARYAALYGRPSKDAADQLKNGSLQNGSLQVLVMPEAFPNQGGVPIKVDGKTLGGMACRGAASEVDEAVAQVGVDALLK